MKFYTKNEILENKFHIN